jgi:pimeloyl-ACP methyl ester carboxylesterase
VEPAPAARRGPLALGGCRPAGSWRLGTAAPGTPSARWLLLSHRSLTTTSPVVVLGHSLGGVVALTLASGWFGLQVAGAIALGSKVAWTGEELAKARASAERPVTVFRSREEAVARALRLAGLTGMVSEASVERLVAEVDDGWRLALDPPVFGVGEPDAAGLLAAARSPVVLARGATDPMVSAEQLAALAPDPVDVPGTGHNAHVEDPAAVAALLAPFG